MSRLSVSYLWREPRATAGFRCGVSLHSHTCHSKETLDFLAELSTEWPVLQPVMRWCERRCERFTGIRPDYAKGFWTPPLNPKQAFDLERAQIEDELQLRAMVSLTDHDDIAAPMLLRSVGSARGIPVSLEWTVPYCETAFHLGIHNLPAAEAQGWMQCFEAFTKAGSGEGSGRRLNEMLAALNDLPGVLIVFNHPLWDLYRVGEARHEVLVNDFLAVHGQFLHALELNGLRSWKENREAAELAGRWNQLTISGGDRHGLEPNANVNLTNATCFSEFVHEIRRERRSHVVFLPQYSQPWKHRILQSTLDAVRNHPHFPEGRKRWDERVFHPDAEGEVKPLSELWYGGDAPMYLSALVALVRTMGRMPVSTGLRMVWNDTGEMQAELGRVKA